MNLPKNQKTILVTGVFDVLHQEHLKFLNKAKAEGDFLLVGIEADHRVRQIKGQSRPIHDQNHRQKQLETLAVVDRVIILPEDFDQENVRENFVKTVKPAILAISSHTSHQSEKKRLIEKYGGVVKIVHQHNPHISTTLALNNQKKTKA